MLERRLIVLLLLLIVIPRGLAITKQDPLQMCDSSSCSLSLKLESSNYQFAVFNSLLLTYNYFVLCVRQRVVTQLQNNNCELDGLTNSYSCLGITPTITSGAVSSLTVQTWTTDATLSSSPSSKSTYAGSSSVTSTQSTVNLNTLLGITTMTDISSTTNKPKIYEVYAGYVDALRNDGRTKNAFFHTFRISAQTASDDLFMQRHPQCMLFYYSTYYNYNLVFYGGTIRGGNETMFINVLSYLEDTSGAFPTAANLNAWIGIALSQSHAGRDMMAFITANSTLVDLYSLYYHSPYPDTSQNIKGENDLKQISDSTTYTKGANTFYYSGGLQRLYNTGDFRGDEVIMKKINNTYCLAIGYSSNPNTVPYDPTDNSNNHDYYACFSSTVELAESYLVVSILVMLLVALSL